MYQTTKTFFQDEICALIATHISLQTGTTKFQQDYVGLLVINTLLDSTHHKLRDSDHGVLLDMFHLNRLLLAFTSPGTINTQHELNKAIQGTNAINNTAHAASNTKSIQQ